jgi:hypothetical protein
MINNLGKGLVLVALAISVLFLAWAVAIYTQAIDWGWKDPRVELKERVPSEIDKRLAALTEAMRFKARADAGVKSAEASLADAEKDYPRNVLLYRDKLHELQNGEGKIKVVEIKYKDGVPVRSDKRATAPPEFDPVVPGADKSVAGYFGDLKKVHDEIDKTAKEIKDLTEKQEVLTVNLNGHKDPKGNVDKVGMYKLLEDEKRRQEQVKEETEYLQPLWVRELVDAQLLLARQGRLDQRIQELKRPAPRQ